MSKIKVSASAPGLSSRRLFLASGPAAAVLMSLREAVGDGAPIAAVVRRHRAVAEVFEAFFVNLGRLLPDDPRHAGMMDEFSQLSDAEDSALEAVCACPVKSQADARTKSEYLTQYFDETGQLTPAQIEALLRSLVA